MPYKWVYPECSCYQGLMTRHNLASHISWLLSHTVTPPVGVRAPNSADLTTTARAIPEGISENTVEEEDFRRPTSPESSRATAKPGSECQKFLRPTLPYTSIQKGSSLEFGGNPRLDSMGKLSSASKSARPALLSQQQQLATPASTSGPSSLTSRYAVSLRTSNGLINMLCITNS